jgi:hypothetical protein
LGDCRSAAKRNKNRKEEIIVDFSVRRSIRFCLSLLNKCQSIFSGTRCGVIYPLQNRHIYP